MFECKLPTSRRGDSDQELLDFLAGNEQWYARNAMLGWMDASGCVHVSQARGSPKYIEYRQAPDNSFTFPPMEAVALVFSKRLIIFRDTEIGPVPISAHYAFSVASCLGIPIHSIFYYAMFSRFAVSARKPSPIPPDATPCVLSQGYGSLLERAAVLGPKQRTGVIDRLYPPTHPIKSPENHGIPINSTLSITGSNPIQNQEHSILYPISFKCLISIKPAPICNNHILKFV
jgi:hypothetical protein